MSVNGVEIKEGQVWIDGRGKKRTMEFIPENDVFIWKGRLDDGEWDTYTEDGTYYRDEPSINDLMFLSQAVYTIPEVLEAIKYVLDFEWEGGNVDAIQRLEKHFNKRADPDYVKYLELRKKYEGF